MQFRLFRGQRARYEQYDSVRDGGRLSLQDARLAAWALAVGEIRSADGRAYGISRPHRGMLPDVDFAIAAPAPKRPSLLRVLVARLFRRRAKARGSPPLAGHLPQVLGESPPATYIGVTEAGDPAVFAGMLQAMASDYSRAA